MNHLNKLMASTILISSSFITQALADTEVGKTSVVDIVDQQLVAYNNRDIDAFLATYHDDVEIYDFPSKLTHKGKEALRKSYSAMFSNLKCLNAVSLNRIIVGNYVTDHEKMHACRDNADVITFQMKVTVTYEVQNGLIKRVMFYN